MIFKYRVKINDSWYILDNYVIATDPVPFISRNKDGSLVADGVKFTLSEKYTNTIPSVIVNANFEVIWDSIACIYAGTVESIVFDKEKRTYAVSVKNNLLKLKDKKVEYGTINSYLPDDRHSGTDSNMVSLLDVIVACFEACGIHAERAVSSYTVGTIAAYDDTQYTGVLSDELLIDRGALWCINQNVATSHITIDSDKKYNDLKITCWDLVAFILQFLRFGLYLDGSTYYIVGLPEVYTPNNDIIYNRYQLTKEVSNNDYNNLISCTWLAIPQSGLTFTPYRQNTVTSELTTYTDKYDNTQGLTTKSVTWYNNFMVYYLHESNYGLFAPTQNQYSAARYLKDDISGVWSKEEFNSNMEVVAGISNNRNNIEKYHINIEEQESEIIQYFKTES